MRSEFFTAILALAAIVIPYRAEADSVVCESVYGGRNYCGMDTRGGVHIYKHLSKTDCVEGRNWGWGPRGVWVDDGCRAVFASGWRRGPEYGYRGRYDYDDRYRGRYDYRDDYWQRPVRCPPGTRPNDHRCTNEERRRGCKDYNMGEGRPACSNFGP